MFLHGATVFADGAGTSLAVKVVFRFSLAYHAVLVGGNAQLLDVPEL